MPKVHGTRKEKAMELLEMIKNGPSFSGEPFHMPFTPKEAKQQYDLWASSWICSRVVELIPELKKARLK